MEPNAIATTIQQTLKTLESNPIIPLIASGGLTVWIITNLKAILLFIKNLIVSMISFNVHNAYEDARGNGWATRPNQIIFNQIISSSYALWERNKHLDLSNLQVVAPYDSQYPSTSVEDIKKEISNDTYGFSIRILYGCIVFCWRYQKADGQKMMIQTDLQVFFGWKSKFIRSLEDDIAKRMSLETEMMKTRNYVGVFFGQRNGFSKKNKRKLDSIFTSNDEHIQLYQDIKKFIDNKETYKRLNYPYKYSAIIYGKPGTGKSSTILAIASELNRDVEYINLATSTVVSLTERLNDRTSEKIFVFEDVDALNSDTFSDRSKKDQETNQTCIINTGKDSIKVMSISLSDLLNITDGLLSSDGAICIFTTNHIEKLDPALLRPGRMNKMIEFNYLDGKTAKRMVRSYIREDVGDFKDCIKPAELQEAILSIVLKKSDVHALDKFLKEV